MAFATITHGILLDQLRGLYYRKSVLVNIVWEGKVSLTAPHLQGVLELDTLIYPAKHVLYMLGEVIHCFRVCTNEVFDVQTQNLNAVWSGYGERFNPDKTVAFWSFRVRDVSIIGLG